VATSLEATVLRNNEEPSPEGATEFSPALQRWGEGSELQVPYGQLSFSSILRWHRFVSIWDHPTVFCRNAHTPIQSLSSKTFGLALAPRFWPDLQEV